MIPSGSQKQYCGTIGKVENCQVGVFAAYASEHGYGLIDKRLYIPEKWFSDEYHHRGVKCKLPEEVEFKSKPQLAAEMLTSIAQQQMLPFKYVLADSIYGASPVFIETVESLTEATYFVSVPENTLCWLKKPMTIEKQYKYKGEIRTKTVLSDADQKPISVSTLAPKYQQLFLVSPRGL